MDQWYILFINAKWVLICKYLKNRFVFLPEGEPLQSCLFCFWFLVVFFVFFRFYLVGGCPKGFVVLGVRHQRYGKALWLSKYKVVQK